MLKYAAVLAAVFAMTATAANAQQTTTAPGCTPQQAGGMSRPALGQPAGAGGGPSLPARGQPAGATPC